MSEWESNRRSLAASSYQRWQPPSWDSAGSDADPLQTGVSGASSPIAAAALEQLQQDAYAEAHALGLEEGRAAGRQESAAQVARWSALIDALTQPWKMVDRRVETELIKLVQVLVRQLLERELRDSPEILLGWVRAGLAALPRDADPVEIRMHPEDAAWVRDQLEENPRWRIAEDDQLACGACRIQGADAEVDAGLDARLAAAFSQAFDGMTGGVEAFHDA